MSCQSNGATASMIPVSPAHRNWNRNAQQKSIGVSKRMRRRTWWPSQLKILIPVGTAISIVEAAKNVFERAPHADREHVVGPDAQATKPMATVAATRVA